MSRLTDLIARAKAKHPALGDELEREFRALASRRTSGLNVERHRPESMKLPDRPIRRGGIVLNSPSASHRIGVIDGCDRRRVPTGLTRCTPFEISRPDFM